jgi:uncharacterized protein (TIGR00251 family)
MEQLGKFTFKLHINVKTNSKRQEIINGENFLIVHVRAKPIRNKANNELIHFLRNKLKIASNQIEILSGIKSKNKILKITFQEEEGKQLLINRLFN